ncbi:MAG: T9SS type A sorting domain-containing protein, partial [Bacteroidetes bacterium]
QNYPNPFNSKTTIKYSVPESSKVVLKIYNLLGKEIETIVNEQKPAGTYEVTWNAAGFPNGIYFYRLQAGDFLFTRKMILNRNRPVKYLLD